MTFLGSRIASFGGKAAATALVVHLNSSSAIATLILRNLHAIVYIGNYDSSHDTKATVKSATPGQLQLLKSSIRHHSSPSILLQPGRLPCRPGERLHVLASIIYSTGCTIPGFSAHLVGENRANGTILSSPHSLLFVPPLVHLLCLGFQGSLNEKNVKP